MARRDDQRAAQLEQPTRAAWEFHRPAVTVVDVAEYGARNRLVGMVAPQYPLTRRPFKMSIAQRSLRRAEHAIWGTACIQTADASCGPH